jgi:hypothetical protein
MGKYCPALLARDGAFPARIALVLELKHPASSNPKNHPAKRARKIEIHEPIQR